MPHRSQLRLPTLCYLQLPLLKTSQSIGDAAWHGWPHLRNEQSHLPLLVPHGERCMCHWFRHWDKIFWNLWHRRYVCVIKGFKIEEENLRFCSVSFLTAFFLSFGVLVALILQHSLNIIGWSLATLWKQRKYKHLHIPAWNNPFPGIVSHFSHATLQCSFYRLCTRNWLVYAWNGLRCCL